MNKKIISFLILMTFILFNIQKVNAYTDSDCKERFETIAHNFYKLYGNDLCIFASKPQEPPPGMAIVSKCLGLVEYNDLCYNVISLEDRELTLDEKLYVVKKMLSEEISDNPDGPYIQTPDYTPEEFWPTIPDESQDNQDNQEPIVSDNVYDSLCSISNNGVRQAVKIIGYFIRVILWIVPFLIILFGMIDFVKAVVSKDDNAISGASVSLIRRVIIGVVVFFIPTIILSILHVIEVTGNIEEEENSQFGACTKCIFDPFKCKVD